MGKEAGGGSEGGREGEREGGRPFVRRLQERAENSKQGEELRGVIETRFFVRHM